MILLLLLLLIFLLVIIIMAIVNVYNFLLVDKMGKKWFEMNFFAYLSLDIVPSCLIGCCIIFHRIFHRAFEDHGKIIFEHGCCYPDCHFHDEYEHQRNGELDEWWKSFGSGLNDFFKEFWGRLMWEKKFERSIRVFLHFFCFSNTYCHQQVVIFFYGTITSEESDEKNYGTCDYKNNGWSDYSTLQEMTEVSNIREH